MTKAELEKIISRGEGVQTECKLSREKLSTSMWETYSAFANTHGGTILLGVRQHGDEFESTAILITKWPDRFEFRNPGTMRVRPTKAGASDCRNRNLQRMFMFVGYSEQAGSGYPKILSGWRGEHWAEPFISDNYDDCQTSLTLKLNDITATEHHIVPYDVSETKEGAAETAVAANGIPQKKPHETVEKTVEKTVVESGAENSVELGEKLGERRLKIVELVSTNAKVSISELADKVGISQTAIENNLRWLKMQGIIRRVGPDKGGHWEVIG